MNIKKFQTVSFFLVALLIFASCSPKVYVQKDDTANLANYKSFAWVETKETHEQKGHNDIQENKIRNAVSAELIKAGWREDTTKPDAVLAYDVLVEKTIKRGSNSVYSQPFSRVYFNRYTRRMGTIYYPSQFMGYSNTQYQVNEGTLTISFIDAQTDKMIWQGWTTEEVNTKLFTDKEIQVSVRNIFRKFDVAKR
ncbi:MAG: DUF4136 domain-containing protein [Sediminibacterium sp.]|nr:MAG: hypothetical protein FD183_3 [Chitinophagaceae bacterium]MDP1842533.1 DUF4136 domain-containing protein [Sediminibacterium sp.]